MYSFYQKGNKKCIEEKHMNTQTHSALLHERF